MRGILIAPAGLAAMAVLAGCGSAAVTPTQHVASHSVTVDVSVGGGRQTSTVQVSLQSGGGAASSSCGPVNGRGPAKLVVVHVRGVGGGSDTCADGGTPYQDMLATAPNAAALDRSLLSSGVVTGESEVTYLRKLGVPRALARRLAARWYREHNISSSGAPGT